MGNSSSADKLTDAETTALEHFNSKEFASLMKLLEQEPVDLFKIVSFNEDKPEDIKNGRDFVHTLLSVDHQSFGSSSSSAVSILKAFKQTIESNKQKNTTDGSSKKLFRENPQFDKFPYSYLQFVIFNNPQDLESFIFLLDNKEIFPSPPSASQSLVHDLCSYPRAIELLRHLISSGEFPERFKNTSSTNNLDEQMRGSANSVNIDIHCSFTPLQAACAAVNKLAVQELCVAGLGGSNYGECAETLLTTAIAREQHHNIGSLVLFKKANRPQEVSADDVSDILLCLLAQPTAGSSIRKHRVHFSSIQSQKARNGVVAVFKSKFNVSPDAMNLMHLAFAFYDGLNKNTKNNTSPDTFLKTVLDNKLVVCTPEELALNSDIVTSEILFSAITRKQALDLSSFHKLTDDETLRCVSSAISSLQSLNLASCDRITDTGLQHLAKISSLQSLKLYSCKKITDSGLQHLAQLSSLQSLNLESCFRFTDSGLLHLAKLSSLQSLNLQDCQQITDNGLQHLAKLLSIQSLNLACCNNITDNGLQHLSILSALRSVNLRHCTNITNSGLQLLMKLTSLQTLNLTDCRLITDDGLQNLEKLPSLQTLHLGGCNQITDIGLQHLVKLSSLESLDLYRCYEITNDGLGHLANLLALQSLNLGGCSLITDSGLEHLAKLSTLQSLSLETCTNHKITDNGLQHLTKLPSLQMLNLQWCRSITDSGLQHLEKLPSLQTLNIKSCNKITDSGLEQLRTKLPSVEILH